MLLVKCFRVTFLHFLADFLLGKVTDKLFDFSETLEKAILEDYL